MRNMRVLGLGLALLAGGAGVVPAQDVDGLNVQQLFGQLDTNDDKVVDSKEVPESGRPAFEQLLKLGDLNENGKLELEEYRALSVIVREDAGPGASGASTPRQIMAMDEDDDGKVSKEEFQGPAARFDRLDADKDGFLTRREATSARARGKAGTPPSGRPRRVMGMAAARFEELDADKDGKVSKEEYQGPAFRFNGLDADKDGFITKAESTPSGEAVDTPAVGPRRRPGAGIGAVLAGVGFEALDEDDDGKVSKEEYRGPAPLFDRLDADKDGFVTKEETAAMAERLRELAMKRFQAMDKDDDGKVSKEEYQGSAARFDRLDADKDGFLTESENTQRPSTASGGAIGRGPFRGMDRDGDGKVSPDEFRGRRQAFDRLDADKDGFLSAGEFRAGRPAQGKARSRPPVRPEPKPEASGAEKREEDPDKPKVAEEDKAPEKARSPNDE